MARMASASPGDDALLAALSAPGMCDSAAQILGDISRPHPLYEHRPRDIVDSACALMGSLFRDDSDLEACDAAISALLDHVRSKPVVCSPSKEGSGIQCVESGAFAWLDAARSKRHRLVSTYRALLEAVGMKLAASLLE